MSTLTSQLSRAGRRRRHTGGQALVPVIFVVLILTAFALTVAVTARREVKASGAGVRDMQAYYIARGAVNYAAAQLQQTSNAGAMPPQVAPPPDTDANNWTQFGEGWYKVDVIDTASRVNLNTAAAADLMRLPGLTDDPSIAASIVDWRDTDETPTVVSGGSGAESDYYQSLSPPYNAKNAPFDTIDELLLVRGITPELLYGTGTTNPNPLANSPLTNTTGGYGSRAAHTRQTPGGGTGTGGTGGTGGNTGAQADATTAGSTTPLFELLTTFSRERNVSVDGNARVNVLTGTQQQLTQAGVPTSAARWIVQHQQATDPNDPRNRLWLQIKKLSDVTNGLNRSTLGQCADKLTDTTASYRTNVVNLNTAPSEVLATIPSIKQATVDAIVQARQGGATFSSMNDVFTQLSSVQASDLQNLYQYGCTKSSVYIIRVRVRMNGTSKVYAAQALVDLGTSTDTPPTILHWKEIQRSPGWSQWTAAPSYNTSSGANVGNP